LKVDDFVRIIHRRTGLVANCFTIEAVIAASGVLILVPDALARYRVASSLTHVGYD